MNKLVRSSQLFYLFGLLTVLSLACGFQSFMPAIPTFPAFPPTPGISNVPTGSSPMSGDWNANTEFGRFAFTVDPDGKNVTTAVLEISGWTCGNTKITTNTQELNTWLINSGEFIADFELDSNHLHTLTLNGAYDEENGKFSGIWTEDEHGTICSGTWESIARK